MLIVICIRWITLFDLWTAAAISTGARSNTLLNNKNKEKRSHIFSSCESEGKFTQELDGTRGGLSSNFSSVLSSQKLQLSVYFCLCSTLKSQKMVDHDFSSSFSTLLAHHLITHKPILPKSFSVSFLSQRVFFLWEATAIRSVNSGVRRNGWFRGGLQSRAVAGKA